MLSESEKRSLLADEVTFRAVGGLGADVLFGSGCGRVCACAGGLGGGGISCQATLNNRLGVNIDLGGDLVEAREIAHWMRSHCGL